MDAVKHKSFVEVNEEGTEAAAVTGITMNATSVHIPEKPFEMILDRPFLFLIEDAATKEILFAGIFATMMPALDWLQTNAGRFGQPTETLFFWSSGMLSSVLDNAPTYLSFLSAMFGAFVNQETIGQIQHLIATGGADLAQAAEPVRHTYEALQKYDALHLANKSVDVDYIQAACLLGNASLNGLIVAISIAAVFFGANTYIGNGPNFMVKSIAVQQKVHAPGFIGFILKFTIPIMMPMLVLVWLLFFRQ